MDIVIDTDGNAYIGGVSNSYIYPTTQGAYSNFNSSISYIQQTWFNDVVVTKLNPSGSNLVYSTYIGGGFSDNIGGIAIDNAGSVYITGYFSVAPSWNGNYYPVTSNAYLTEFLTGYSVPFVTKFSSDGSSLVYSTYLAKYNAIGTDISVDSMGYAYVVGNTNLSTFYVTYNNIQSQLEGMNDGFITILNPLGSSLEFSSYLGGSKEDNINCLALVNDRRIFIGGKTQSINFDTTNGVYQTAHGGGTEDGFVAEIKVWGNTKGRVYLDYNTNCMKDNTEPLSQIPLLVSIQPGNYISQVSQGYWYVDTLPPGNYIATIDTSGQWKASCSPSVSFTVVHPDSFVIVPSIGMYNINSCPDPQISIFMPFMRPCFSHQWIKVKACNTAMGTDILHNAYADVQLDSLIQVDSASLPHTALGNGVYRFLLDSLYPGQCKEWYIYTTVSCSAVLGQTLCLKAELYPVPACAVDSTSNTVTGVSPCTLPWDKSSLSVSGACVNDSVRFVIYNTGDPGDGDMQCFMPIRLYADGLLVHLDSLKIHGGDSLVIQFAGDGRTWRIEVDQHPLHPGNSHPNATVQACGNGGFGSPDWTPGLVNVLPHDDAEPWKDIYCGEVTMAYDPNDKTGYPLGVGEDRHIAPNQPIEYLIRFQNTGTDTAFKVVIRDTLSTNLDIYSVRLGVASHPYTFRMYGQRVLEWTFENIMLPDSHTNEPASHGFVTFSVEQVADLPDNTILANSAAIYFDFNAPVITNTYEHTVMRSVVTSRDASVENSGGMRVYPNPSSGLLQVEWGGGSCVVELLNVQGQVLDRYELRGGKGVVDMSGYPAGLYLLKGTQNGRVKVLKLVKE